MDNYRFIYKCYTFQLRKVERNEKCWLFYVKNILCSYGFGDVWFSQYVNDKKLFINNLKLRLIDIERQKFFEQIQLHSKLHHYVSYKKNNLS